MFNRLHQTFAPRPRASEADIEWRTSWSSPLPPALASIDALQAGYSFHSCGFYDDDDWGIIPDRACRVLAIPPTQSPELCPSPVTVLPQTLRPSASPEKGHREPSIRMRAYRDPLLVSQNSWVEQGPHLSEAFDLSH